MKRAPTLFIVLALLISQIVLLPCAQAATEILNIRHWVAPDHTRVVIDVGGQPLYQVKKEEPQQLGILVENAVVSPQQPQQLILNKPGLDAIAVRQEETGIRVELALPAGVQTTVFTLKPFEGNPHRIVVDISLPDVTRQQQEARERVKVDRKDRVIVIDPGHGGEAPGAVGRNGTKEKDVVLQIARKLRDSLNQKPGYRAFLTRDGDYYVSFRKRMQIAREYGADLFVSVHADAAVNRTASGGSVYVLSTRGASSEAARILAQNENMADIAGGVANGESNTDADPIILNMFQTNAINQSKEFGALLLKNFQGSVNIKYNAVQEAPFLVLKMPEIPSVLIETAYISNLQEEKLLKSDRFQTQIVTAVVRSILEFVPPHPLTAVTVATAVPPKAVPVKATSPKVTPPRASPAKATPPKPVFYLVKRGDNLGKIARQHGVSVGELAKANGLNPRAALYVGTRLKIPPAVTVAAANGQEEKKTPAKAASAQTALPKPLFYLVKKGDTLENIARQHGVSVGELAKANGLNPRATLYANSRLKIPSADPKGSNGT